MERLINLEVKKKYMHEAKLRLVQIDLSLLKTNFIFHKFEIAFISQQSALYPSLNKPLENLKQSASSIHSSWNFVCLRLKTI